MTTFEILFSLSLFALTLVLIIALGLIKQYGDKLAASAPPEVVEALRLIASALIPLAQKGIDNLGEIAKETPNKIDDALFDLTSRVEEAIYQLVEPHEEETSHLEQNDDKA